MIEFKMNNFEHNNISIIYERILFMQRYYSEGIFYGKTNWRCTFI
ncbi:hypothetical protein BN1318_280005 [Staphylococcus capitis]|nr:hypothetical protein BN1318_280005 [Staphylococcus capitis]